MANRITATYDPAATLADGYVLKWNAASGLFVPGAPASGATFVTSLPGSPTDGQEVYLQVAVGINWHLRYNAASASAYKWEFLGGSALTDEVATAESRANAAYGALTTAGPSIVLPNAGDYVVEIGASITVGASADDALMSFDIGATGAVDADSVEATASVNSALYDYASVARSMLKTGLTAVTLTAKYRTGGGSSTFKRRFMKVTPRRIS